MHTLNYNDVKNFDFEILIKIFGLDSHELKTVYLTYSYKIKLLRMKLPTRLISQQTYQLEGFLKSFGNQSSSFWPKNSKIILFIR